jgi:hypothetical protein
MDISLIVAIIIAMLGWIFGFYQMCLKRHWQKKDFLKSKRCEVYSAFMQKIEEINRSMRNNPNVIYGLTDELMRSFMNGKTEDIDEALLKFNQRLVDYVQDSVTPLMIINQEISSLLLIASEPILKKLIVLKSLIEDFNQEMQSCLSRINVRDVNSFKVFETMTQDKRWGEFSVLKDEIIMLMRKELDVK